MRCIDDEPNGIILNHNSGWTGDVRIAWYHADERHDPGPTPPSMRECWCSGPDLVAGRFTPTSGPPDKTLSSAPPVDIITRAVALAVETYLRAKIMRAAEDLFINRGKL